MGTRLALHTSRWGSCCSFLLCLTWQAVAVSAASRITAKQSEHLYLCSWQAPTEVLLPEAVTSVAAGHYHTLCLSESGAIWCMGSNEFGQLGVGAKNPPLHVPRLVKALSGDAPDPWLFSKSDVVRNANSGVKFSGSWHSLSRRFGNLDSFTSVSLCCLAFCLYQPMRMHSSKILLPVVMRTWWYSGTSKPQVLSCRLEDCPDCCRQQPLYGSVKHRYSINGIQQLIWHTFRLSATSVHRVHPAN